MPKLTIWGGGGGGGGGGRRRRPILEMGMLACMCKLILYESHYESHDQSDMSHMTSHTGVT